MKGKELVWEIKKYRLVVVKQMSHEMYSVGNIVSNYVISNIFAWRYILTYFADQFEMYTNIKSLCCITRINIMMSVSWLVFREYAFSMSALWCPLETCIILLGFLLPWAWGISSRLLQQNAATAPYLGCVGHGREVWQNVVHCRREWQTTSVFLPWEPHE